MRPPPATRAAPPEARPPPAVDEGALAEALPAVVLRYENTQRLRALVGVDLNGAPTFEPNGEPFDDAPLAVERLRRADDPLGPLGVGSREDLFRRQVRHVRDPVDRLVAASDPP